MVTIGSATLDIFLKSEKFKVVKSEDVPSGLAICEVYGGKMEVEEVNITSGGGGTNCAVSFAKKDLKTATIVEMGNDPAALIVYKDLEEAGIDTRYVVQEPDETTAVSAILISHDGGRSIIVYRGASAMLDNKDIPWSELKTRWIHVTSLGGNVGLLAKIIDWAKKEKVRVSLNPGMTEIEKKGQLMKLLPKVEMLFVNKEEASELFGVKFADEKVWRSREFLKMSRVTVITDGARGGKVCIEGKCLWFEGKKVRKVVDTTGAGDAFASGMVSGVLYGLPYEEALDWGVKNSASVLRYVGAKKGLLTLAEVRK